MATVADTGRNSENFVAPTRVAQEGRTGEENPWIDYATSEAAAIKQTLVAATDSVMIAAGSGLSRILSTSSSVLQETKGLMEWAKREYDLYEDMAVGKIKEGILVAASHQTISCAVVAGVGLVVFKRPRRFLIHNTRRLFMSEESLLSDAETKVSELRQSINLVKNESRKLEERALKAEEEMGRGRRTLIKEGREIQGELRFVNRIEREATGLKDLISELPRRDASKFRSEVSTLLSQVKKEKVALSRVVSKIVNYGIPI